MYTQKVVIILLTTLTHKFKICFIWDALAFQESLHKENNDDAKEDDSKEDEEDADVSIQDVMDDVCNEGEIDMLQDAYDESQMVGFRPEVIFYAVSIIQ